MCCVTTFIFFYIPLLACWQAETSDLWFYNKIYLYLTNKFIILLYLHLYIFLIASYIFSFFLPFILFYVPSLFLYCLFPFRFISCLPLSTYLFLPSLIFLRFNFMSSLLRPHCFRKAPASVHYCKAHVLPFIINSHWSLKQIMVKCL